jgi:hypothetical protein
MAIPGKITAIQSGIAPLGSNTPQKTSRQCSKSLLLGQRPQPAQAGSDITHPYANKSGQPPPGSRIFIWTRQAINSPKDALKRTCADAPPPEKQRQGRGSSAASPWQYLSTKHVASMFLGCS